MQVPRASGVVARHALWHRVEVVQLAQSTQGAPSIALAVAQAPTSIALALQIAARPRRLRLLAATIVALLELLVFTRSQVTTRIILSLSLTHSVSIVSHTRTVAFLTREYAHLPLCVQPPLSTPVFSALSHLHSHNQSFARRFDRMSVSPINTTPTAAPATDRR